MLWRWLAGGMILFLVVSCSPLPGHGEAVPVSPAATASPSLPEVVLTSTPPLPEETLKAPASQPAQTEEPQMEFWQEPAGCRPSEEQWGETPAEWLAYADSLLGWTHPLAKRALPRIWHPQKKETLLSQNGVYAFDVSDVHPRYLIQQALNALHVAGFAAWLRHDAQNGLEILAVPFTRQALEGVWGEYLREYWLSPTSSPQGDERIIPTMKLTPCRWMVESGMAPNVPAGTMEQSHWKMPDWAKAANAYLAEDSEQAYRVAFRINWLGDGDNEGPRTMCGPLAWAILCDAQSFPPGYGEWSEGPKTFWLPKPSVNGRPWSLFPPETYLVQRFDEPAGTFDFSRFPLTAGDVLYLYGKGDGFDHVVLVTEVDEQGNVYAVTNRVWVEPELRFAIQRVVLYNAHDPTVGILRNEWAKDRVNGRTGHGGFEVFRWKWRQKQLDGQPVQTTVEVGDTLPLLAMKWHTPPEQIAAANGLTNNTSLTIGMTVQIP